MIRSKVAKLGLALALLGCGGEKGTLTVKIRTPPGQDDPFLEAVEVRMIVGDKTTTAPVMDGRFSVKIEVQEPNKEDAVRLTLEAVNAGGQVVGRGRTPPFVLLPQNSEITVYVGRPGRVTATEVALQNEGKQPLGRQDLQGASLRGRVTQPLPERALGALLVGGVGPDGTGEPSGWLYDVLTHSLVAAGKPAKARRGAALVPTADGDAGQQAILWGGAVVLGGQEVELPTAAEIFDPNMASLSSVFQPASAEVAEAGQPGVVGPTVTEVKEGTFLASGGRTANQGAPVNQAVVLTRFPAPEGQSDRRARPGVRRLFGSMGRTEVMAAARFGHSQTRVALPEGAGLLLFGGLADGDTTGPVAELFIEPRSEFRPLELFLQMGDMKVPVPSRRGHAAAALRDGRVLIMGGVRQGPMGQVVEDSGLLIDARNQQVALLPGLLSSARHGAVATIVGDEILLCGGLGPSGQALATCDVLGVDSGMRVRDPISLPTARAGHVQLVLETDQVLFAGGVGSDGRLPAAMDLYTPLK